MQEKGSRQIGAGDYADDIADIQYPSIFILE